MTTENSVSTLRANLAALNESDQRFARSLLSGLDRWGRLSDKQAYWVSTLALRATTAPAPRAPVGDLAPMIALFETAAQHLRHPALVFGTPAGDIRLSVAGPRSRYPGSINVTTPGAFAARLWYGRIHRDGTFEASSSGNVPDGLLASLQSFAANPAQQAAAHGHLTGNCCFCTRPLSDARSTSVGYGPVCADHWGLPWGARE